MQNSERYKGKHEEHSQNTVLKSEAGFNLVRHGVFPLWKYKGEDPSLQGVSWSNESR